MDEDDEAAGVTPQLTKAQAKRELEELEEFRSLGVLSEAEYTTKKRILDDILGASGRNAGSFRPKSERSQAADVVDALLAELG